MTDINKAPWEPLKAPPPKGTPTWFWLTPKNEADTKAKAQSYHGTFGNWSDRLIATHWIPPKS
jgi:hypothetical protein